MVSRRIGFIGTVLLASLAACQGEGPPPLSLDEARKVVASFDGQAFQPPPKTITDIEKLLASQSPVNPAVAANDRVLIATQPPTGMEAPDAAEFYYRRAQAAERLGLLTQTLADLKAAHGRIRPELGRRMRQAISRDLASTYRRFGNFEAALKVSKYLADNPVNQVSRMADLGIMSRIYARWGDTDRAAKYLAKADSVLARFGRSIKRTPFDIQSRNLQYSRAVLHHVQGNLQEAEASARAAVDLARTVRQDNPRWAHRFDNFYGFILNFYARVLISEGKLIQAEIVIRDAIRDALEHQGGYARRTVEQLQGLGDVLAAQGRDEDARRIARHVLKTYQEMGMDRGSFPVLEARQLIGLTYARQGRWTNAAEAFGEIAKALEGQPKFYFRRLVGSENAIVLTKAGKHAAAIQIAAELLRHRLRTVGENSVSTAFARGALAMAHGTAGEDAEALEHFAKAVPILMKFARQSTGDKSSRTVNDFRIRVILEAYIDLLARIVGSGLESRLKATASVVAFRASQAASARGVQRALVASAARAAARDPDLADLVRKEQDAVTRIGSLNNLLAGALDAESHDREAVAKLRRRIEALSRAQLALAADIRRRFPDYARLMTPEPGTIREVRAALRRGEVLIKTHVGEKATYVWAVPKSGPARFAVTPLGREQIGAMIGELRLALDTEATTLAGVPEFDVGLAHQLYRAVLAPVQDSWRETKSLLVVADGPLGQLPFSVLVTEPARLKRAKPPLFSNYRAVPFLARSHSVTVLPSVNALITLRAVPPGAGGRRAFAGFGDPWFNKRRSRPADTVGTGIETAVADRRGPIAIRGQPIHLRAAPKVTKLSSADLARLPRLPDTAAEVRDIATALKADLRRDVFLGKAASEDRVKTMKLSIYRVVAFATHGLVPGDLDGLTQPALALSSPEVIGGKEDGLLTMGEILGLKLDADWVVLSACNTASGQGAGAEAVSGLGRAFFYAGSRALLVSNWAVETTSARLFTTDLFRRQAKVPSLTRAEAMRQSMLALMDGPGFKDANGRTVYSYAHPIFWAPFSLVGDD